MLQDDKMREIESTASSFQRLTRYIIFGENRVTFKIDICSINR